MDGNFFVDCKPPFPQNVATATTLTAANQAIYPNGHLPVLGNYFNYVGRALYMRSWGICSSGATPGNFGINFFWGNNTNNNGTNLCNVAYAWAASQTNSVFCWELWARARAIGASGSLFCYGNIFIAGSGILHFNYTNPAAVTVDLTQPNYISPQVNRSGSTAETIQPYHIFHQSLN